MQLKCISKVCPGWIKEIVTLFRDPAFLKLTHNFMIVSEADPGQPRGKREAKAGKYTVFPVLLVALVPSSGMRWGPWPGILCHEQAAAPAAPGAVPLMGPAQQLRSAPARKELRAPCSPVPGRQPLCLTLAGAQLGLEVCFNWGRGQRRGDAPTSPVCLSRSLIQRRWRFFDSTQSDAGRRNLERLSQEKPLRRDSRRRRRRRQQPQHEGERGGRGQSAGCCGSPVPEPRHLPHRWERPGQGFRALGHLCVRV